MQEWHMACCVWGADVFLFQQRFRRLTEEDTLEKEHKHSVFKTEQLSSFFEHLRTIFSLCRYKNES